MSSPGDLFGLSSWPAIGTFAGALLAECMHLTPRRLSLALHAAAGVLLAVVAVELIPTALHESPPWVGITSFVAGGGAFIALDRYLGNIRARAGKQARGSGPWTIYASVAIDLVSDGIMIGVGSVISPRLAWVLALGQALADIPQGLATMALLKERATRGRRLLLVALLSAPLYAGTAIGYYGLRGRSHLLQFAILGFTAGLLITLAVEEIIPQAHVRDQSHSAAAVFVLSFAAFIALTSYL
jgi:zinc transporter, ZIP family